MDEREPMTLGPPRRRLGIGRRLVLAMGGAVAAGVIATLAPHPWRDQSIDKIRAAGRVRIGYAIEAPYAFRDSRGLVRGEAPEIAAAIVSALGIDHVEWRQAEFNDLISLLLAGQIDVVAAGMFITDSRRELVAFSRPTLHVRPAVLVAKGNPRGFMSLEDALSRPDCRIAVLAGAVEECLLRQLKLESGRVVAVPDALTGRRAVESGVVDALLLSAPTIRWMTTHDAAGTMIAVTGGEQFQSSPFTAYGLTAFAFRKEDRRLVTAWDHALEAYLDSEPHHRLLAGLGLASPEVAALLPGADGSR